MAQQTDSRAVGRGETRARIVDTAARLLKEQGPAAVTTRAVAETAGVQAPAIYRLFGDKDGLLEAVAEHVMAGYVSAKAATVATASALHVDPLEDLRSGWDAQIEFGIANPTLFRLLSDPDRVVHSPAARSGRQVLEARIHRIALSGRLRVSEQRAIDLIQAAGIGTIHTLLSTPTDQRDPGLADAAYEAVLQKVLTDEPDRGDAAPTVATSAATFRGIVPRLDVLTDAERQLLTQWLDRVIDHP